MYYREGGGGAPSSAPLNGGARKGSHCLEEGGGGGGEIGPFSHIVAHPLSVMNDRSLEHCNKVKHSLLVKPTSQ